ncbi:MAG: bacterial Ig-like domain-containing protein [Firmicutes bacterium]|nr:bacterial Ig-like domain-containing protein [Bacillota bacterium]
MTKHKQKSTVKILSALAAVLLAVAVFFTAASWLNSLRAYAAPADPVMVTVTYYDGPLTRGFTWQTETGVTGGKVQLVEKTGALTKSTVSEAEWAAGTQVTAVSSSVNYVNTSGQATTPVKAYLTWKAAHTFTAADSGKTFFYRVGTEGNWSDVGEQKIDNGAAKDVTMIHVTDPQGRDQNVFNLWSTTLTAAKDKFPNMSSFVFTGDFTQEGRANGQWAMSLDTPKAVLMDTVLMPAPGNHDWEAGGYCEPAQFKARFHINAEDNYYYSYDYGNVHVTVLNTNTPSWKSGRIDTAQVDWLKADLAAAEANPAIEWKVVAQHHPMVSVGRYATETNGSNGDVRTHTRNLRRDLMPVFAQYKVDLVMQGHEHVYTRSKPISWTAAPSDWGIHSTDAAASTGFEAKTYNLYGENRKYMEEPKGTVYIDMSPAGGSRRQEVLTTATDINALIDTVPQGLPNADGKAALQPEQWTNSDAGQKGMFGALRIKGGVLLYETYSVDGGTPVLIDYVGIDKDPTGDKTPVVDNPGGNTDDAVVAAVIAAINALPGTITSANATAVAAARALFNALTPAQQALVTNLSKLTAAEAALNSGGSLTVTGITITAQPDKTRYKIGEELDLAGLVVTATMSDGSSKVLTASDYQLSAFNSKSSGSKKITVTYADQTATFTVTVEKKGGGCGCGTVADAGGIFPMIGASMLILFVLPLFGRKKFKENR